MMALGLTECFSYRYFRYNYS